MLTRYRQQVAAGALKPDAAQEAAAARLAQLVRQLRKYQGGFSLFRRKQDPPQGLYIWGDVGRGKSMLMDQFFAAVPTRPKRRVHFNAFMLDVHERIHAERAKAASSDPIPPVARVLAGEAKLLCFDEFQIGRASCRERV